MQWQGAHFNLRTRVWSFAPLILIGGGLHNGVFYAFDPRIKSWAYKTVNGPQSTAFMAMDYDPVSNAYIILTPQRETWAYRWQ